MTNDEARTLHYMDVVLSKHTNSLHRVERVEVDPAGRVCVYLFGKLTNWSARPDRLALVYRANSIPPGAYVRLGNVYPERMDAVRQAIAARQQEQDTDKERNGDIDHGNTE